MADDIDDLLNEVENAYLTPKSSGKGQTKVVKKNTPKAQQKSELDDMIDDIFDDDIPQSKTEKHSKTTTPSRSSISSSLKETTSFGAGSGKKCFPVFLSGASCVNGVATAINKRSCDRLRCTDCDFLVSIFDNYQWHSSTDYLFLRNNIPDFERLKPKLVKKKGSRAYACQCKSRSLTEITDLQQQSDLKWVCGKH